MNQKRAGPFSPKTIPIMIPLEVNTIICLIGSQWDRVHHQINSHSSGKTPKLNKAKVPHFSFILLLNFLAHFHLQVGGHLSNSLP